MRQRGVWSSLGGGMTLLLVMAAFACSGPAWAESFIVKDGQARAEIVVSEHRARMVQLAASELQTYVEKTSGAKLPITTEPSGKYPVQIYVGKSAYTDRLKVFGDDLKHGAFRMVSGENSLALVGKDADFVPREPYGRGRGDRARVLKEWDALTGEKWENRHTSLFKLYNKDLDIWQDDDRGTINAVYKFLRDLGVRWYFPGELGEITPRMKSIALPGVNKIVRPDFAVRNIYQYYQEFFGGSEDEIKWQLRLGLNSGHELLGLRRAHGITEVHARDEVKKSHPEYFALYGGKRAFDHHGGDGAPCLSSEGLLQDNVKYARALFDIYDDPTVNVAPVDGYYALCQCDGCKGKGTPGRGYSGRMSDYVWGYVNRVAQELYKTHPNKKVSCIAYGAYQLPPEKIDKMSPNVVVTVCRWRSLFHNPDTRKQFLDLRKAWLEKLPSKEMYIYDYYLHARPGSPWETVPVYFPRLIAEDLRSLKGKSRGDFIEVYRNRPDQSHEGHALASNHLNVYITARMYWNTDQDLDALLDEYYDKFYGPAREEMKAFIEYAEANWPKATKEVEVIDRLFERIGAAQKAAGDTIYGRRVDLVVHYMERLKQLRERLTRGRENVPEARALRRNQADIKLDGKLDDKFWEGVRVYTLREIQTGRPPQYGTSFRVAWGSDDSLYFGIRCEDRDTETLNIATRKDGDTSIWTGDTLEILFETPTHSYYQITINPAGAMLDLDRKQGHNTLWSSGAQVATHIGDGIWTLEVRLPVAGEEARELDPQNGIAGKRPSRVYPWYFNVCRQRVRDNSTELSAWSPTGKRHFHELMKFGKLWVK